MQEERVPSCKRDANPGEGEGTSSLKSHALIKKIDENLCKKLPVSPYLGGGGSVEKTFMRPKHKRGVFPSGRRLFSGERNRCSLGGKKPDPQEKEVLKEEGRESNIPNRKRVEPQATIEALTVGK